MAEPSLSLLIKIKKNLIDLEYKSVLQNRNAVLLGEATIPFTVLNIFISLGYLRFPTSITSLALVVLIAILIDFQRTKLNEELLEKQRQVEDLINELQASPKEEPD